MRRLTALGYLAGLAALALAGCDTLPPGATIAGTQQTAADVGKPAGKNQVGEECEWRADNAKTLDVAASSAYGVWCGTWQQPSAHVFEAREGAGSSLAALATAGAWRAYLDQFLTCEGPAATSILDGIPSELLNCKRRNGGWPHVALATSLGGRTYLVDSVPSALPAVEVAMAGLSGHAAPAASARASAATLLAQRYAGQPFGSGDLDRYYGLMRVGDEKNEVDDFPGAEDAFRDALDVQQKIIGAKNPGTAGTTMHLALQISNQQRFAEADGLFAQAASLAQSISDPLIIAELNYYLALHNANRRDVARAKAFAAKAEEQYAAVVPAYIREAARHGVGGAAIRAGDGSGPLPFLTLDPATEAGVQGLVEVWRFEASLAYQQRDFEDARKYAGEARGLLDLGGFIAPPTLPRVVRLAALGEGGIGNLGSADRDLTRSAELFDRLTPNEKPLAITWLLAGRAARERGATAEALADFRRGARLLRDRHMGVSDRLIVPYLETLLEEAAAKPAQKPALDAEMFEAAQLIQGGLTAQYIAKASARLASGDRRVSVALRQLQEAEIALKTLFAERDVESQKPAALQNQDRLSVIDAEIVKAQAARDEAEGAAQTAAPAYAQLVQSQATAARVMALLQPDEGLLAIQVSGSTSVGFLVTRSGVLAYPIALAADEASGIVDHLRQSAQVDSEGKPAAYDVAAAHDLYAKLIAPAAPALRGIDRLVVSTNGALLSFPFEILVSEAAAPVTNGDYRAVPFLVKRFTLSYVPAPQSFVRLREVKAGSQAPMPYVGFGDLHPPSHAQLAQTFPPDRCKADLDAMSALGGLPGTREEITRAGAILNARPEDIILGAKFTKAALLHAGLDRYRILHLATHAFLPTELRCKSEPTILMSPPSGAPSANDAFLDAGGILNLDLDADLIILSACNTAGPAGAGGESLSGLARAFFFAGSRGLLVTHWSVEDESAKFIITRAIESMKPGAAQKDSATALREAKLALLSGRALGSGSALYSHPFAWAPFVLIGDGVHSYPTTARKQAPPTSG
jgi:CHAT domain-containing protein